MKINVVSASKLHHTVTVPRDYLEGLEAFYEENMRNHYNMRGDIRMTRHPDKDAASGYSEKEHLFIADEELSVSRIIVVDKNGKELRRYIEIPHTLDTLL